VAFKASPTSPRRSIGSLLGSTTPWSPVFFNGETHPLRMAATKTTSQLYRNEQLKDVADAIDHMTLGVGSLETPEPLLAPTFKPKAAG
jgi:hypothetical protein